MSLAHSTGSNVRSRDSAIDGPASFFLHAYAAYLRAEMKCNGPINRWYNVGDYPVRLRFANEALVPTMSRALEHLTTTAHRSPDLTVCLWDSASTGSAMPPPPWSDSDYRERSEIRGYNTNGYRTAYELGSNFLSMLDTERNVALFWTRDADELPSYVSSAPLRTILHWWAGGHEHRLVHAGAVGTSDGGVLLAGKGGSGKSTTALACLDSDLSYVSDDYCLLESDPEPYAHSLYSSGKFGPGSVPHLPHLTSKINNADGLDTEKAIVFLNQHYPEKLTAGFPVRAVFIPRVHDQTHTTITPASRMESLHALAPSTLFQLSGAGRDAFADLATFAKNTPAYHLNLGSHTPSTPAAISDFLS